MYRVTARHLALALLVAGLEACGGSEACGDPEVSILDPMSGQQITSADDATPGDPMVHYVFVLEGRCLEDGERVSLEMLSPAASPYAAGVPDAMGVYQTAPLPLFPGINRFVAIGEVSGARSEEVEVNVSF
jgi:hypothetical protein